MSKDSESELELECAAAFKYQKFHTLKEANSWYKDNERYMENSNSNESLLKLALKASDPFQFLSRVKSNQKADKSQRFTQVPVSQDASASAYQIMSYLLLNKEMGELTNLLPSGTGKIQDLYLSLRDDLEKFLKKEVINENTFFIINKFLTRKLVKGLFMPLIYGKTEYGMRDDILSHYGLLLSHTDIINLTKLCHKFWMEKYPGIANLMKLINLIGWFCSVLEKPVIYTTSYYGTVQDYLSSKKEVIWIYDRSKKKNRKHQVTLRVATSERDCRKTKTATCVNFIHQKDAYIAMKVVEKFTEKSGKGPIYTVHDNFITTSLNVKLLPNIYTDTFLDLPSPLTMINLFICMNLKIEYFEGIVDMESTIKEHFVKLKCSSNMKPHHSSKWDDNMKVFLNCYDNYIKTVCCQGPSGIMSHEEKVKEYKAFLSKWDKLKYNFCLHY
jgi:DNA-directed RNA polymerase